MISKTHSHADDKSMHELTFRAVIIGATLGVILSIYNVYLGLKIGRTTSSSIVIAAISAAILKLFGKSNILEHNMVQTLASTGDAVAAGAIFTLPALIMLGCWSSFSYTQTFGIIFAGCLLGVALTVPLRRLMILKMKLNYPMGVATAAIIKTKHKTQYNEMGWLVKGGALGGFIVLLQSGLAIIPKKIGLWATRCTALFGLDLGLGVIELVSGFMSGPVIASSILAGLIIRIIYTFCYTNAAGTGELFINSANDAIKMVAVGAMVCGGLFSLASFARHAMPTRSMLRDIFKRKTTKSVAKAHRERVDIDMPGWSVALLLLIASIAIATLFNHYLPETSVLASWLPRWCSVAFLTSACVLVSLTCTIVGAQIVGYSLIVPLSGITVLGILLFSVIMISWFLPVINITGLPVIQKDILSIMVICASIVCISAIIGSDNMQDLKAGHILGSTPWKQQVMLIVGGLTSAAIVAPLLQILMDTYGFSSIHDHSTQKENFLPAPQASLIAALTYSILDNNLQWHPLILGASIALSLQLINYAVQNKYKTQSKFSVLTMSLGLYLPLTTTTALVMGGFLRASMRKQSEEGDCSIVAASGMIAGAAMADILITMLEVTGNPIIRPVATALSVPMSYIYDAFRSIITAVAAYIIYIFLLRSTNHRHLPA